MTTTLSPHKLYTSEEYFALEAESERTDGIRREFRNGELIEMTGGTPAHNKIAGAIYSMLWFSLRKQPYSLFIADQRLWIPELGMYTYPDVMVIQNPLQLKEGRKDTVTNPTLIVEVLSPSTESYDRGAKFAAYRSIPTLQEYLLIEQSGIHVEHYRRQGDVEWIFRDYDSPDAQIQLPSLKVEISLADIYADIELEHEGDATSPT